MDMSKINLPQFPGYSSETATKILSQIQTTSHDMVTVKNLKLPDYGKAMIILTICYVLQ